MRVGIMTGGGDAPGLNGIIESASRVLLSRGVEVLGIEDGFEGIFEERVRRILPEHLHQLHDRAGTCLGTSNRGRLEGRAKEFQSQFAKLNLDGMIVAGGDGTFNALAKLGPDIPVVGVPKTIDNDLPGTELTFGFDTACSVVANAVESLRATAHAHRRVMWVETMGRTAGWIALGGGLASYADVILIPERPFSRKRLTEFFKDRLASGARGLVCVVSEAAHADGEDPLVAHRVADATQQERYGGIAERMARWTERETQWESRHVVLGHLQRSSQPTPQDRLLTSQMGVLAAEKALAGQWSTAVVYRSGTVTVVPLGVIQGGVRVVPADHSWIGIARALGGFI